MNQDIQNELLEVITKKMSTSEIIRHFVRSSNPKFKGKTKAERIRMALGAKYSMGEEVVLTERNKINKAKKDAVLKKREDAGDIGDRSWGQHVSDTVRDRYDRNDGSEKAQPRWKRKGEERVDLLKKRKLLPDHRKPKYHILDKYTHFAMPEWTPKTKAANLKSYIKDKRRFNKEEFNSLMIDSICSSVTEQFDITDEQLQELSTNTYARVAKKAAHRLDMSAKMGAFDRSVVNKNAHGKDGVDPKEHLRIGNHAKAIVNALTLAGRKNKIKEELFLQLIRSRNTANIEEAKSSYDSYHAQYNSAVGHAADHIEKVSGMRPHPDHMMNIPKKPSAGQTTKHSLQLHTKDGKPTNKYMHYSVYNMNHPDRPDEHKKPYELTTYHDSGKAKVDEEADVQENNELIELSSKTLQSFIDKTHEKRRNSKIPASKIWQKTKAVMKAHDKIHGVPPMFPSKKK